jgi:hypothetical protein
MPTLFEPVILGNLEAPNRILMAPMTRARKRREHGGAMLVPRTTSFLDEVRISREGIRSIIDGVSLPERRAPLPLGQPAPSMKFDSETLLATNRSG